MLIFALIYYIILFGKNQIGIFHAGTNLHTKYALFRKFWGLEATEHHEPIIHTTFHHNALKSIYIALYPHFVYNIGRL